VSLEGAPEGGCGLHAADLLHPGSFDAVIQGCDAVFHTASPFFTANVTDPQVSDRKRQPVAATANASATPGAPTSSSSLP